jgi:hypothetical protein
MRKRTRYLRLRTETIDRQPASHIGRSSGHPEDVVKVALRDDAETDRGYILAMPLSEARAFVAQLSAMVKR